jgi:two-component system, OmpR family, KDP operon response regulator KdpE
MKNASIQIVDNDPQVRKLIAVNLESWDYHIKDAESDFEAIFFLKNSPPDLLLLDLKREREQHQFSISALRDFFHNPIILIADKHYEAELSKALDAGATDFITKPLRATEVLTRVNKALDAPTKTPGRDHIFSNGSSWNDLSLTETEHHLLFLLSSYDGKLFTQRALIRKVVGESTEDGPQQIKSLIAQLRKKIEKDPNRPVHIITEIGIGYRFVGNS